MLNCGLHRAEGHWNGMEARTLKFVATACDGERLSGSETTPVGRIRTDSRLVQAGDVFFALPGERFDGHNFLAEAAGKGAAAVVVERHRLPAVLPPVGVIAVDHTRRALGRLAERHRQEFSLPIIAVAGSNGKTTTKELIAAVLRQQLATLWSDASFNNDIGVPLTLLRLEPGHQVAVLEAGTNHPGELAPLVKMIRPDYGVITCIGREHLEFFGDLEGVFREEGALAEGLPPAGKLLVNGDDPWTPRLVQRTRAVVLRVGFNADNDWRATGIRLDKRGATFRVSGPPPAFVGEYRVSLLGKHQVLNALFAAALGAELGLDRAAIQRGLAACKTPPMRLQLWEHHGVRVLDDAYNANADSMLAALQTLRDLPCRGRRVAVLGDMAELGAHAEAAHEEIGRRAAELGVGQLFAVGKMAPVMARAARAAGLNRVLEFPDAESAGAALRSFVKTGDVLLLKASRAARLERVAEWLRADEVARRN
jgi:UDP-N-acetylmuramoyl-tripeptide--D-alanyl-D-alanine ligase